MAENGCSSNGGEFSDTSGNDKTTVGAGLLCLPSCRLNVCSLRIPFLDPLANFGNVAKPD